MGDVGAVERRGAVPEIPRKRGRLVSPAGARVVEMERGAGVVLDGRVEHSEICGRTHVPHEWGYQGMLVERAVPRVEKVPVVSIVRCKGVVGEVIVPVVAVNTIIPEIIRLTNGWINVSVGARVVDELVHVYLVLLTPIIKYNANVRVVYNRVVENDI